MKNNRGITLIALVVTIVVLLILAAITINLIFGQDGVIGRAKQSRFYYIISSLEEDARLRAYNLYFEKKTMEELIPNYGALSEEEKNTIVKEIPTLNESVYRATNETVYDRNLYWLNKEEILKNDRKYIIDMETLQVYDYEGEFFLGKRWHTIDIGIDIGHGDGESGEGGSGEEIPDGYMRIHLDYPKDAIDKQWRIGRPGENRADGNLIWQDYTGPILVKIDDIKNIWIRYNLKGVEVVVPPKGTLAVDIRPNTTAPYQEKVTIDVYFEPGSTNQRVKIGNGGWKLYKGAFEVTENCTIEAMAEKEVEVADQNGNSLGTTTLKGKDSYKVANIGQKPINQTLPAPTIVDMGKQEAEKTTARIDYPTDQGNIKKVYKLDSGIEQDYVGNIKIDEWGIELIAYYYTEDGNKSPEARKTFNDPTVLDVNILYQPNPALDDKIKETTVEIEYSDEAENKTYKIDNEIEQNYTKPFKITKDCTITAYAKKTGLTTATDIAQIKFKVPPQMQRPRFSQTVNPDETAATVTIIYDNNATIKKYSINGSELQDYTGSIPNLKNGTVIYAYSENEKGEATDATFNVNIQRTPLQVPRFSQTVSPDETAATVTITYDSKATVRKYKINNGELQNYIGPIQNLHDGDIVYAYCENIHGESTNATHNVKIQKTPLKIPQFSQSNNSDNTVATVTITYDSKATVRKYKVNDGGLQNYTGPIQNLKNGDTIYAYCENARGESSDANYTVNLQKKPMQIPQFSQSNNQDNTAATVTITYDSKATVKKYKVNGGELQNYTGPIPDLQDGDTIYAYCEDAQGDSVSGNYVVKLEPLTAPVISPNYMQDNSKVSISIAYDKNAVTKQYRINGGPLQNYTAPFEVTENGTVIYAVNANSKGETRDTTYTVSGIIKKLDVKITANPDTTQEVEKVTVTIDYDNKATEKTYRINSGVSQNYTGPFEVTKNCTIIAEAKATDAYGKDTKQITNLPTGLAAPVITMNKTQEPGGDIANISIDYDKKSISNTYSINSEPMKDYTTGFQVRENGTVINAYSVDKFGNTATSQYVVNNLIRYLLIDKGKYYWIKLPYPEQAINKQYKYKTDGVWKAYKEDGFILVKSEYKDELIQGGKPVRLEVEPGRYVDFDGHWYILDSDPQKLQEDIYMKWDDPDNGSTPKLPLQILSMPAPPEITDKVDVFIIYPATATKKQYKINDGAYQDYNSKLEITKNNTKITAKTQYSDGSWSEEVSYIVTNINENVTPEGIVEITAEPQQPTKQNVTVTITYNPNSTVLKKKYKIGNEAWQYTENNTVTLTIEQNTTIYAALENEQGQSSRSTVYNVENIDKSPPKISLIEVLDVGDDFISISTKATDDVGIQKYEYKLNTGTFEVGEKEHIFTNLTKGQNYSITVRVTDNVGNYKEEKLNVATGVIFIRNAQELQAIANNVEADYIIANDIDLSGITWNPIELFAGTLNGNNHKIDNLNIDNCSTNGVGLFASTVSGAEIRNININNARVNNKGEKVSILIGEAKGTKVENINIGGQIIATDNEKEQLHVGTAIGFANTTTLNNANINANININEVSSLVKYINVGGAIGSSEDVSTNTNIVTTGKISMTSSTNVHTSYSRYVGGIFGKVTHVNEENSSSSTIKDSHADVEIDVSGYSPKSSSSFAGGFVGRIYGRFSVNNCFSLGNIKVDDNNPDAKWNVGGFAGIISGRPIMKKDGRYTPYYATVSDCYSNMNITTVGTSVGGFAGDITSTVQRSYATGKVIYNKKPESTISSTVGGFAGSTSSDCAETSKSGLVKVIGRVSICYSTCNLEINANDTKETYVGGIVSTNRAANVSNCFSACNIVGNNKNIIAGGIISSQFGIKTSVFEDIIRATVSNCYTMATITGITNLAGAVNIVNKDQSIGSCYYISEAIGNSTSTNGKEIQTYELGKQKASYSGFNFTSTWDIQEGITTPYLRALEIPNCVYK